MDADEKALQTLLATTAHEYACGCSQSWCAMRGPSFQPGPSITKALAEAGWLLLPPGGQVRIGWHVLYVDQRGVDRPREYDNKTDEEIAVEIGAVTAWGWLVDEVKRRTVTTWPDGRVLTTPWVRVPTPATHPAVVAAARGELA